MSGDITPAQIKGLYYQLVKACGTATAASAFLGCSEQRVRQLYNTANEDLPTVLQIIVLEAAVGRPIVTEGLATLIKGNAGGDAVKEACDVVEAAGRVLGAARHGTKRELQVATADLQREVADLPVILAANGN